VLRIVLVLLGCLLAGPAVAAYSFDHQISDLDRYAQAVTPVVDDPVVRQEIAARVTDAINTALTVPAAARQLVGIAVTKFVESDTFRTVWAASNRAAQPQVVAMLRGEPSTLRIEDDMVLLDLGAVTDQLKAQLVADNVPFARSLPEINASVRLFSRPAIRRAIPAFAALQSLSVVLPIAAAALIAAGLIFFRRRSTTLIATGIGLVVAMLLLLLYQWIARGQLTATSQSPRLAGAFYDALTDPMNVLLWVVSGIGVLTAACGLVGFVHNRRPL
jgi:hypothetical protein